MHLKVNIRICAMHSTVMRVPCHLECKCLVTCPCCRKTMSHCALAAGGVWEGIWPDICCGVSEGLPVQRRPLIILLGSGPRLARAGMALVWIMGSGWLLAFAAYHVGG